MQAANWLFFISTTPRFSQHAQQPVVKARQPMNRKATQYKICAREEGSANRDAAFRHTEALRILEVCSQVLRGLPAITERDRDELIIVCADVQIPPDM